MHVVVSGAAGHLGKALLPRLCAAPDVERVTGVDLRAGGFTHARYREHLADVASAEAVRLLRGADAVVHLAFVLLRGRRRAEAMTSANVDATSTFLGAAADAGVGRLVFVSSAAVYGAGEDLREDAPLAPLPGFLYAQNKRECECWLAAQLPRAAVLRPHAILGPHALPLLKRLAASPLLPRLPAPAPLLQCVHEDDVCDALLLALRAESARGPFNLAAPTTFTLEELVRSLRPGALALPLPLLRFGLRTAWRIGGWGGEPAWLDGVSRTLTLDCSRARGELGWRPHYSDWRRIVAETFAPA